MIIFSGYFIRRNSGTIKRFWCIRYGTNIEVKIRDCPGAFGTDGGSGTRLKKMIMIIIMIIIISITEKPFTSK